MWSKKIITILQVAVAMLLVHNVAMAQMISVSCKITGGEGKYFRLLKTSDYISHETEQIFAGIIGKNESVNINFTNQTTEEYTLCVDFAFTNLVLQPDVMYDISLKLPQNPNTTDNPFTNPQYLEAEITSSDIYDVNNVIAQFNYDYDRLLLNNIGHIKNNNFTFHETFEKEYLQKVEHYNDAFLNTYIKYSIAATNLSLMPQDSISNIYICNENPQYNNPAYMDFLQQYFQLYGFELNCNAQTNQQTANLALISKIHAAFANKMISQQKYRQYLMDVAQKSTHPEIQKICNNLINKSEKLLAGSDINDFVVLDENKKEYHLTQLATHNETYLFFFKSNLKQNVETLNNLLQKNVVVIPIDMSLSPQPVDAENIEIYLPENVVQLNELFRIRKYPFVVVIDDNRKVINFY